ncbi:zinc-binding dehydrogenase [Streptomyces olivaceoviridis]|uniref:zinc-binding dehydrogenase n=1 Tax=Streptomyces olivaceoviridis TaxID=1921 RepID=UPI0036F80FBD
MPNLDGGGASTFWRSIEVLRRVGTLVYFGPLIGDIPTVRTFDLPRSIRITYAVFADHVHTQELLLSHAGDLFEKIREGKLSVDITERYPLDGAAQAHRDIESRRTSGKLLLDP